MGLSTSTIQVTTAAVAAAGTSVSPSAAVPDNCHTISVYNPSATVTAYVSVGAPGGPAGSGTGMPIPPSAERVMEVGIITKRASGVLDQASVAGSGLRFDATGAVTLLIMYLNSSVGAVGE